MVGLPCTMGREMTAIPEGSQPWIIMGMSVEPTGARGLIRTSIMPRSRSGVSAGIISWSVAEDVSAEGLESSKPLYPGTTFRYESSGET